jgi:hypothetical protein
MNCTYHPSNEAKSFCQNCGRPLCSECVRQVGSAVYGPECYMAQPTSPNFVPGQAPGFPPPQGSGPQPAVAALLGFIPGVGAMYNGQFLKALIHVLTFTILVSIAQEVNPVGFLVAFFICYQVFEAYQTARARREGQPLPDPFRINELAARMGINAQTPPTIPTAPFSPYNQPVPPPPGVAQQAAPGQSAGYPPYAPPQPPPPAGCGPYHYPNPGYPPMPPMPPVPPPDYLCRREPIAAIVLILLGTMFLLGTWTHRFFHFGWPVFLIALGLWLVFKNFRGIQGGPR